MKIRIALSAAAAAFVLINASTASAWDYEGHRLVNQLALASLPKDFPAFVSAPAAQERIAFLAGEADRWRNTPDQALKHVNAPDHYIDLEELAPFGLKPETLPPLRYDFVAHVARERGAHPEKFPAIDPAKNSDHTRELVGLLPWTITEYYAKLKSEFSYLKAFEAAGGTLRDIVALRIYVVHIAENVEEVGSALREVFTTNPPTSTWIGVSSLAVPEFLIEIEATAVLE